MFKKKRKEKKKSVNLILNMPPEKEIKQKKTKK